MGFSCRLKSGRPGWIFKLAIFFAYFFSSSAALALVELRVSHGLYSSQLNLQDAYRLDGAPSNTPATGYGVEFLVMPALMPIGLGLRFESHGFKLESEIATYDWATSRTAIVLNSRLLESPIILGPIFTYGISQASSLKVIRPVGSSHRPTEVANWSGNDLRSYSAGVELGASLAGFVLGAELGYQAFLWTGATNARDNSAEHDFDMSGTYLRLILGFGL